MLKIQDARAGNQILTAHQDRSTIPLFPLKALCSPDSASGEQLRQPTLNGTYTMLGSPMGLKITPAVFQNRILEECIKPTGFFGLPENGLNLWVDDTLGYASSFSKILQILHKTLKAMIAKNVHLGIDKLVLPTKKITFCGRELSAGSWRFCRSHFDKVLTIEPPEYTYQLAQMLHVIN